MAAAVSLREITASTVRAVTGLTVSPAQARYVAGNAVSIADAYFCPEAWFRAVYLGDEPAGFVMLRDSTLSPAPRHEVSLWRFMVDARFQRSGVGRSALGLAMAQAGTRPGVTAVSTSYVVGPDSPLGFYLAFGFRETGVVRPNGEVELTYDLPQPSSAPNA